MMKCMFSLYLLLVSAAELAGFCCWTYWFLLFELPGFCWWTYWFLYWWTCWFQLLNLLDSAAELTGFYCWYSWYTVYDVNIAIILLTIIFIIIIIYLIIVTPSLETPSSSSPLLIWSCNEFKTQPSFDVINESKHYHYIYILPIIISIILPSLYFKNPLRRNTESMPSVISSFLIYWFLSTCLLPL